MPRKKIIKPDTTIQNAKVLPTPQEVAQAFHNGLGAALGLPDPRYGVQLSQADTLFKNLRWYLISNMRQLLSQMYVELGLIQAIVDIPVDDGLRGGIQIKTKQLDPEEIELIQSDMERAGDIEICGSANKWNRLFGGAGVLIMTDQDPSRPLEISKIRPDSPLEFRDVDMWELFWSFQNTDDYAAVIDGNQLSEVEYYDYYGAKVHRSRVLPMRGIRAPSFIRPRLRGWGVSVVEILVRSINQYLKSTDLVFEVLDEFKVDVYKIKNLTNTLLTPQGEANVRRRIAMANQQKNFQNAITMDSEDDFIQKELTFTGIAETMEGIRMQIASDLRMPLTKIFGISAAGFSSGEDDIENYNAMVESQVRNKCKYELMKMVELRCQKRFGYVPDDLQIGFKPLRILSAEQEENVKTQKFQRLLQAAQTGLITPQDFTDGCNTDNLLPVQVESTDIELGVQEDGGDADETEEPGKGKKAGAAGKKSATAPKSAPVAKNSMEYDLASYQTDGGDNQFDPHHERDFEKAYKIDRGLLDRGKQLSIRAFGEEKWQFVLWYYKQHGGKFR